MIIHKGVYTSFGCSNNKWMIFPTKFPSATKHIYHSGDTKISKIVTFGTLEILKYLKGDFTPKISLRSDAFFIWSCDWTLLLLKRQRSDSHCKYSTLWPSFWLAIEEPDLDNLWFEQEIVPFHTVGLFCVMQIHL